jgi:hypothetical protein
MCQLYVTHDTITLNYKYALNKQIKSIYNQKEMWLANFTAQHVQLTHNVLK